MPAAKNIFIFGDSITYGEWDELGGWANRVRSFYDSPELPLPKKYFVTYNLGIPSDTSTGVAQRLTAETQARLTPNPNVDTFQFIIAIGTNDSRWLVDEKKHGVDETQFKRNLEDITNQAKAFSDNIIFVGLLPCDEKAIAETAKRFDWVESYENRYIEKYNQIIQQHCIEQQLAFIDLFKTFKSKNIKTLFDDGIHPNTDGHALIFETVIKSLNEQH